MARARLATVACVLRHGGAYDSRWVRSLYRGVWEHWPTERLSFVCLTDVAVDIPGVRTVPLEHDWPGWWAKMELFRPGLFPGPVVAFDLDTLIVGPLRDLASHALDFAMISDVWEPKYAQSGVLAWTPGETSRMAWDIFTDDPAARMREFRGDGEFLRSVVDPAVRLQDVFPGLICGFKVRRPRGIIPGPPEGASVICAHGEPRFSSPTAGWAHGVWKGRAA